MWFFIGVASVEKAGFPLRDFVASVEKNTLSTYREPNGEDYNYGAPRGKILPSLHRSGTFVLSIQTQVVGLMSAAKHKGVYLNA